MLEVDEVTRIIEMAESGAYRASRQLAEAADVSQGTVLTIRKGHHRHQLTGAVGRICETRLEERDRYKALVATKQRSRPGRRRG